MYKRALTLTMFVLKKQLAAISCMSFYAMWTGVGVE